MIVQLFGTFMQNVPLSRNQLVHRISPVFAIDDPDHFKLDVVGFRYASMTCVVRTPRTVWLVVAPSPMLRKELPRVALDTPAMYSPCGP